MHPTVCSCIILLRLRILNCVSIELPHPSGLFIEDCENALVFEVRLHVFHLLHPLVQIFVVA